MHYDRLNPTQVSPGAYQAIRGIETHLKSSTLTPTLIELVKLRASQLNGCAFCIDMHTKVARQHGETEQRLYLLSAWHESPLYTARERAALAWTESLTNIAATHAPDADYDALRPHFTDLEIVDLTTLIGLINLWNRLAIGMRYVHDADRPAHAA